VVRLGADANYMAPDNCGDWARSRRGHDPRIRLSDEAPRLIPDQCARSFDSAYQALNVAGDQVPVQIEAGEIFAQPIRIVAGCFARA
jgi:hypothetical protein